MNYRELINEVARRTYLPPQTVRQVIENMTETIIERVTQGERIPFKNFGSFRLASTKKFGITYRLHFKNAMKMKARLTQEMGNMEKYGVQTNKDNTKTASEKPTCPECGAELVAGSNVPKCPTHGTSPFEKKGK